LLHPLSLGSAPVNPDNGILLKGVCEASTKWAQKFHFPYILFRGFVAESGFRKVGKKENNFHLRSTLTWREEKGKEARRRIQTRLGSRGSQGQG
jgi:hypothetical protein